MQEEDVIPDLLVTCVKTCALLFYQAEDGIRDRKSTRLHSSHCPISYAVLCLRQKCYRTRSHGLHLLQCLPDAVTATVRVCLGDLDASSLSRPHYRRVDYG